MEKKGAKSNKYTVEFKLMVVREYLAGTMGYQRLANKYNLPSTHPIRKWVKKYESSKGDAVSAFEDQRKYLSGRPRKKDLSLEEKVIRLEAENAFLKKLMDLRRR
jgi:transposase